MENLLPDISLKIDVEQLEFLKRIEGLLAKDQILEKGYSKSNSEPWFSLAFKVSDPKLKRPYCVIRSDTKNDDRVELQIIASSWPEDPLTYDLYTSKAIEHFEPLISKYNKKFDSRRRIHVQSKESLEPELPKVAKQKFESFVSSANIQIPNKLDWDKFYGFVGHCHVNNVQLRSKNLKRLLVKAGFSQDTAEIFSDAYRHIRRYHQDNFY